MAPGFLSSVLSCIFFFLSPSQEPYNTKGWMFAVWFPSERPESQIHLEFFRHNPPVMSLVLALELRCGNRSGDHVVFSALASIFQDIGDKSSTSHLFLLSFPFTLLSGTLFRNLETSHMFISSGVI